MFKRIRNTWGTVINIWPGSNSAPTGWTKQGEIVRAHVELFEETGRWTNHGKRSTGIS